MDRRTVADVFPGELPCLVAVLRSNDASEGAFSSEECFSLMARIVIRLRFWYFFFRRSIRSSFRRFCLMCPPAYLPSMWISPSRTMSSRLVAIASRIFIKNTQAVLYWHPSSRGSCRALLPFTQFTDSHSPVRMSRKGIFRKAKTVFEVTENSRRHFWHLKHCRRIG